MLQQEKPDDYVIATGETHSVREFCEEAFAYVGLDWKKLRGGRPEVLPPGRGGPAARRPDQGERTELGWKPRVGFRSWSG